MGLLLAIPAALVCILIALFRGHDWRPYAAAGAQHSILLIIPFIYLLATLLFHRSPFPKLVVASVYALVYSLWLTCVTIKALGLTLFLVDIVVLHNYQLGPTVFLAVLYGTVLPVNVLTLSSSIRALRRKVGANQAAGDSPTTLSQDEGYLNPFGGVIAWSLITVLMTLLAGLLGFVGT